MKKTMEDVASFCANITINLMFGGVPESLAKNGVTEILVNNAKLIKEEKYDEVINVLRKEFDFCLRQN